MADLPLAALAWMLIGHAAADYPLQGEWIAKAKNHTPRFESTSAHEMRNQTLGPHARPTCRFTYLRTVD